VTDLPFFSECANPRERERKRQWINTCHTSTFKNTQNTAKHLLIYKRGKCISGWGKSASMWLPEHQRRQMGDNYRTNKIGSCKATESLRKKINITEEITTLVAER